MKLLNHLKNEIWWHGTPDMRSWKTGAHYGIHVGTYGAAQQALCARIGYPKSGMWDGTRRYGDVVLCGRQTLEDLGIFPTGFNCSVPDNDDLPKVAPRYSNGKEIPLSAVPSIFKARIIGPMGSRVIADQTANNRMSRLLKTGNADTGFFYKNDGEDAGSLSAVVPAATWLEIV